MDIEKGVGFPIYATDQFSGMFAKLKGEVSGVQGSFEKLQVAMAATGLAAVFAAAKKAAEESEAATRRLEAVIRATGNASGYTGAQLGVLADQLARVTQFDDEAFRTATATILRFGDVSGKQLERTLKLSADLAAFMGSDLPGAAETLGKAIAAPSQGMDRLQRSVGYFTEAQKAAIKAMDEGGDRLGAQNALLDILQGKIGGTAEVMNQGLTRATRDLTKAVGELLELFGKSDPNGLVVQTLDTISSSLRAVKSIMESGDWANKFLAIVGVGAARGGLIGALLGAGKGLAQVDAASGNQAVGAPDAAADAMIQYKAMAEAELATIKSRDAAIVKLETERREKQKKLAEEFAEEFARDQKRLLDEDVKGWVAHADAVFKTAEENDLAIARINQEFWDGQDKMREEDLKGWVAHAEAVFEEADRTNLAIAAINDAATKNEQGRWKGFLDGVDGAFRDTWDAFVSKGANAGRVLRESLKRTLFDWLYQQFAKPFVLNIVASLGNSLGLSGLGSAATAAAGSGGFGGLGSLLSSAGSFLGGPELLAGAPTFLEGMGSMLSAAGPYVAAIAAAYALYQAFKDKGENWKGKLGFGANANAYTVDGIFGKEGFEYLAGNDATNRAIQAFMGSTGALDRGLASRLTPQQIASITGRLTGVYNTRNDGQPAEFAFGKDDSTAAQQLTLEYLQRKYGTVFDEIDTTFAEFIRGYTGKSEDLLKAIIEFAGLMDALDASGIKGLNITTLRAFKREGEELGDTFARIAKQWATYQDLFYTDAEKIGLAQQSVNAVFSQLGIAVPGSMEEFRNLVEGLDLSTEAGRALFEALMQIAPAFASVSSAAASLLSDFRSIVGAMRPGYNQAVLESDLEKFTKQFMGRNSWTAGMDWRYVSGQIRNITEEDFLAYSPQDRAIINDILRTLHAIDQLNNASSSAAGSINTLGGAAQGAANAMQEAKDGLWEYLRGLYTNPALSPLDPTQQLGVAKAQFLEQLGLAQAGDAGAASGLSSIIGNILNLGRTVFASGAGYNDLFTWVTTLAGDFARPGGGQELQRLAYEESQRQTARLDGIYEVLMRIADQAPVNAAIAAEASLVAGEQVAQAVTQAGISTKRR